MGEQGKYHVLDDGTRLPRVTAILDAISKPMLVHWAARSEREHIMSVVERMGKATALSLSANLDQFAHSHLLNEANEIGSQLHARVEWRLRKMVGRPVGPRPPLSEPALIAYTAWIKWADTYTVTPKFIEQRVWSRKHGYAGTMDLDAEMTIPLRELRPNITSGITVDIDALLDWKTSPRIYGEAGIQNAAYVEALVEMGHAKHPIYGVVVQLPKVFGPRGEVASATMRIFPPETHEARFKLFLAAKEIFQFQEEEAAHFKPVVLPDPVRPPVAVGEEF